MVLSISSEENKTPTQKTRETQGKPKRSFKDVMDKNRPIPKTPKWSVFDFPKHKKTSVIPREKPKEKMSSEHVQYHGESRVEVCGVGSESEVPSILELPPAMQDLVNQMENYVSIESHNGIATIELMMELEDPFGQLQGTIIRIDHYDTHPHSFNILLMNPNETVVNALTAHLPSLLKALQTKLEYFQINLLPPAYPKLEETKSTRKVDKTYQGEKKEERKTRKIERNLFLN